MNVLRSILLQHEEIICKNHRNAFLHFVKRIYPLPTSLLQLGLVLVEFHYLTDFDSKFQWNRRKQFLLKESFYLSSFFERVSQNVALNTIRLIF